MKLNAVDVAPTLTEGLTPKVMLGVVPTETVKFCAVPAILVTVFRTLMVPLYVPAAMFPGTVIPMGDAVNETQATSFNPAEFAVASKSIVYSLGLFVALL